MKLIYLVGLLVVLVTTDLEDEPINGPENDSLNEPYEALDDASYVASDDASYEASDDASDEASDDVESENQTKTGLMYGNKFEGDMILPNKTEIIVSKIATGRINKKYHWPKIGGLVRVPYTIDSVFKKSHKNTITDAMNNIAKKTCIKFIPRTKERDYLHIVSKDGCWSSVGKHSGKQELSLDKGGCVDRGTVKHELIHALGFGHQHNHYQRDQKVTILWDNIIRKEQHNFNILNKHSYDNFGTEYDIKSIMHYEDDAFTKNGKKTIKAKNKSDQRRMGQRSSLSDGDIKRIKKMYEC